MRKTWKRMYLAGADVTALPGGAPTKAASASVTNRGAMAINSALPAFGLTPGANRTTPRGNASLQQLSPQPATEI